MKKFENLGKKLSKEEQKKISGGNYPPDAVCALCAGGNIICGPNSCHAVDYEGLYCPNSSGNPVFYACPQ